MLFACGGLPLLVNAMPLSTRDFNPFLSGFELPPALPAVIDDISDIVSINYAISNIALEQRAENQHVFADAELHRWQVGMAHGISQRWCIAIEMPYQSISGGTLDHFIEHFHSDLSLPNGDRASWPRNRLLLKYDVANQTLYQLDTPHSGIGDMTLRAGWQVPTASAYASMVWFSVKLPTGNARQLSGSGATDFALTLSNEQHANAAFNFYEQLSLSWLGLGPRLPAEQRRIVWSGMVAASWSLTHSVNFLAQIDSHTSAFNSRIRLLGPALQFSIGPKYQAGKWSTSLFITEDLAVDTAPDVQFQFTLARRF